MNDIEKNGSTPYSPLTPEKVAPTLAAILRELHSSVSLEQAKGATGQSWSAFGTLLRELERHAATDKGFREMVEARAAESAQAASTPAGSPAPFTSDALKHRSPGGTVARVFWWGFHMQISHEDLLVLTSTARGINAIVAAIGGTILSPAAPWILLVAGIIQVLLELLKRLDHGRGVHVRMLWFAPGIFVPTTVV